MLRTISKEELKKILEKHKHFIAEDVCGWETMRADLSGADLSGADLRRVDLGWADLSGADLSLADLSGADLLHANLTGVNLRMADLSEANLYDACFVDADLGEACLIRANLSKAVLRFANLRGAVLRGAILKDASCYGADLRDVELWGAILMDADLNRAKLPDPKIMNAICPLNCPGTDAFIGWKRAAINIIGDIESDVIVKLRIMANALRSSATGRKCRCNRAAVLDIQTLDGESLPKGTVAYSIFRPTFTYKVGQKLCVEDFDDNRWDECSTGIHFFMTRQEAVDYCV